MEVKLTLLVRMDVLKITGASLGMTGASTRLKPAETTLQILSHVHQEICSNTDDAGKVEAGWETSGVSRAKEGYVRMDGLGITGALL